MIEESKYLYKYRNFLHSGDKDHTRLLIRNELFFPSPDKFNDPFDSNIPFRYENFTHDEFISYWVAFLKEDKPEMPEEEITQFVENLYKQSCTDVGKERIKKHQESTLKELRSKKVGVFSLSANYNNILSWGHYSDSHRGFCVGFNKEKLTSFCNCDESLDLGKVEYVREYPAINPYKTTLEEKLTKLLWTKSIDWKYEEEYRIIWYDGVKKTLQIENGIIEKVILGCQIDLSNIEKIKAVLKTRPDNISLLKAVTQENNFGLDFEKILYK